MKEIHPARVLYEDPHILVVNKRAGELTVAAGGEGKLPLFDFLQRAHPGLRVLHRLDYQTSGIVVFAKTAEVVRIVREGKFQGWKKCYHALVAGGMERRNGVIRKPLKARTHEGLVAAETTYRVLDIFPFASYVEAQILTGRKHQIRQHFAAIGHPLLLDPLYGDHKKDQGFKRRFRFRQFFLHAYSLDFPHPVTGKALHVTAPLPPAFESVLKELRSTK